jgi:hypothetical protein
VFAPGVAIADVTDIEMYLLTVESWNARVLVRLDGALTDTARFRIAAHQTAMDEWPGRQLAGQQERPPDSVGEEIFRSLTLRVSDDVGTEFRWRSGSSGGTGAELLCEWLFEPAAPDTASTLTVTVATANGIERSHTVGFTAKAD